MGSSESAMARAAGGWKVEAVGQLACGRQFSSPVGEDANLYHEILYLRRCNFFASTLSVEEEEVLSLEEAKVNYFYIYMFYWRCSCI